MLLPLALLGLWALARAAGSVLLILIAAAVVALILTPPVRLFERWLPRGVAIFVVYVLCFAVVAGIAVLLATPVANEVANLAHNFPQIVRHANQRLDNIQHWLTTHGIHIQIKSQGQTALQTLQRDVLKRSGDIVSFSRSLLSGLVTIGLDLILTLVLSVYLLVYGREIGALARRLMPPGDGTPEDDYPRLVQQAVSGYVRGQLLFSLVMGASATVALELFGLLGIFPAGSDYAVFFGVFYGLMEFIPYVGPIIGPIPAVLVGLLESPLTALWLILLFIALQQLEGHIVAPQVFRISLRINPILIILALLIGYQLYGIAGALVALPVIAVLRQTAVYLRRHLVLEPWGQGGLGLLTAEPGTGPPGAPPGAPGAGEPRIRAGRSQSSEPDTEPTDDPWAPVAGPKRID
ncbi:MAG: AI-2E family transporter [Solirubrobacteraceae bacterium]